MTEVTSEGFDLDAMPDASNNSNADEVVFELGGGATAVPTKDDEKDVDSEKIAESSSSQEEDPMARAEEFKALGNEEFKQGAYLEAYDRYTQAMEACPGMTGTELLKLREDFEEQGREAAFKRYRDEEEQRRQTRHERSSEGDDEAQGADGDDKDNKNDEADDKSKPKVFQAPPHPHGTKLAVYYCNRAACLLHLETYKDAIQDCDLAILLNPSYTKAYVRRMTAYEKTDQTEEALRDAQKALECDPTNVAIKQHVKRLQKIEDERMEKLKEETLGKLKDLGNSILGNFGLSLDNFKAEQDPNTGSYSVSFGQNKS